MDLRLSHPEPRVGASQVADFTLEILPDGKVDITKNRRAWKYDMDDLDEAIRAVKKFMGQPCIVTVVEQDGYRKKLRI